MGRYRCCPKIIEDMDHIFRGCTKATQFWALMHNNASWRKYQHLPFKEWVDQNLTSTHHLDKNRTWKDLFAICLWWLCQWRNETIFQKEDISIKAKVALVHNYSIKVSSILSNLSIMHGGRKKSATFWVRWSPPCQGWTMLNSDGCTKRKFNQAGGGGLLRDHQGRWICGFSASFGRCLANEAELWALI